MPLRPGFSGLTVALCVSLAAPTTGHAGEDSKRMCASAFASGQRLMKAGNLIEARAKLIQCGGLECPAAMHPDCEQWLSSVEASIATIVFEVSSTEGQPAINARIAVDGGDSMTLDGRAVSFNPGPHDITFEAAGLLPTTKHIEVSEGEKLRRETVRLAPLLVAKKRNRPAIPPTSAPTVDAETQSHATRFTAPVILAASGAALAGASAIYFGLKARSDDRNLDGCAPSSSCSREATDQVRREYLWTNISIGLAAASATTAIVLFLIRDRSTASPTTRLSISLGPDGFGPVATGTF